jgi:hypothetical protein
MEVRARVGSAALVLDGPGGERVLRAGLEGLSATTRVYPKTLAVRPGAPPRAPDACAQAAGCAACVLVERSGRRSRLSRARVPGKGRDVSAVLTQAVWPVL